MERIRCYKCGKFMGEKDLMNCETKRIYDWDGIPLEDVVMHNDCKKAGGKKVEASDSNCTIHSVSVAKRTFCPICWQPLEDGIVKNMCVNDECPTNLGQNAL